MLVAFKTKINNNRRPFDIKLFALVFYEVTDSLDCCKCSFNMHDFFLFVYLTELQFPVLSLKNEWHDCKNLSKVSNDQA